jgi:hypothetical protein
MWSLALLLLAPADAKPPKILKAIAAQFDPATPARATLEAMRHQVGAAPVDGAIAFSTAAAQVLPLLPEAERTAVVTEAAGYLQTAEAQAPARAWEIDAARGTLLVASGDRAGGEAALRESMAAKPNLVALTPLLALAPAEVGTLCAQSRPVVVDVVGLMELCSAHGDALAWATPADKQAWREEQQREAQAEAERQAALAASFSTPAPSPSFSSSSSSSSSPAPAGPTSVTIHSNCKQTVRVFLGDKPKYGSGTTTTISSNSISSYSLKPGSMIWIVDSSDNGLSSTSVGTSSQRIEISSTCTGFGAN